MEILKKYKKMSIQAKSAVWFAVCSILQKGISFITVPIFVRLLTTEQYGTYSVYLSWLQILTVITSLYLYYGVFNTAMVKFEEDRDKYVSSMQGLTITITTIIFAIYLAFNSMWSKMLGLAPIMIILMFTEMLVEPAFYFWSGRERFDFKYKKLVIVTLVKSIANPFIGLIAVSLTDYKDYARIASVVVIEVVFCGTIMVYQFIKGKCFINKNYWKYALGMAIPLLPHYFSSMILNQGDRVMISKMVGTSEVAFYSVAYSIGMVVNIFTNAINSTFTPWVYQKIKLDDYNGISSIVNMLLLLIQAIAITLMLCSPELVLIFASSDYASSAYVIPPVAASVFFIFLYNILAIVQFYYEKTQFLLISSISAAVVNMVLNYVFIKMFGFVAAGYTTLFCYVLYSIGHYIISQRVIRRFIPGKKLFDSNTIFVMSLLVIGVSLACNLLFNYWYIRYGIILVCAVTVIVKRNMIIGILKGVKNI